MNPAQTLDLFKDAQSIQFWQRNTVSLQNGQLAYEPYLAHPAQSEAEGLQAAYNTHLVLKQVLGSRRSSMVEDDFVVASKNVHAFNKAHPRLPKLDHPSLLCRGLAGPAVRQLSCEFKQVEQRSMLDAAEIQRHCPPVSALNLHNEGNLKNYYIKSMTLLAADSARLSSKYDHLGHLTRAAYKQVMAARKTASSIGIDKFRPNQIAALSVLHKTIKRSVQAVRDDKAVLEQFSGRAASGIMQLKQATFEPHFVEGDVITERQALLLKELQGPADQVTPGGGSVDYPIELMRLPNLFGPGEIVTKSVRTADQIETLFNRALDVVKTLNTEYLRPRASELAVVDAELTDLLKKNSRPSVLFFGDSSLTTGSKKTSLSVADLGPMSPNVLFNRSTGQTRE